MRLKEFGTVAKTTDQLRMDSLKAAKAKAGLAVQAEKQRQKVANAQKALNAAKLAAPKPFSVQ